LHAGGPGLRLPVRLRMDRDVRAGWARVTVRPAARRRLQRGVRRGDERPVVAEPDLPPGLQRDARQLRDLGKSDERQQLPETIAAYLQSTGLTQIVRSARLNTIAL